jgi:hypothetical protein
LLGRDAVLLPHRHGRTERVAERVAERVTDDESVFFAERVADDESVFFTERVTDDESVFFAERVAERVTERVTDERSNGVDSLGRAAAYGKVRLDSSIGANLQGLCDQSIDVVRGRSCRYRSLPSWLYF